MSASTEGDLCPLASGVENKGEEQVTDDSGKMGQHWEALANGDGAHGEATCAADEHSVATPMRVHLSAPHSKYRSPEECRPSTFASGLDERGEQAPGKKRPKRAGDVCCEAQVSSVKQSKHCRERSLLGEHCPLAFSGECHVTQR
eukprot:scaffold105433_cov31-Tisochrysis_lutea.AAC.3